jgi:hypothetical protein
MSDENYKGGDNDWGFHHSRAVDKGIKSVDVSAGVGTAVPRTKGILGAPLASGESTLTARASNNSVPGLNGKLNAAADRAQRSGTVGMPTTRR